MESHADQALTVSPTRIRIRTAAERIERLRAEVKAECSLRDAAIVEALDDDGEKVRVVARDAQLSEARIMAILAAT